MKLAASPDDFSDFIILYLLDALSNKDMLDLKTNPRFATLVKKLNNVGMKSVLMQLFFTVDGNLKIKYKQFRSVLDKKSSDQHQIYVSQDAAYLKKIKNINNLKQSKITAADAVAIAMSLLTNGKKVNKKDLEVLQEQVIKIMEKQGVL